MSARFPRWEKVKDPGDEFRRQTGETKNFNFLAHHSLGNSYSCITADQWDAYDVENTAGRHELFRSGETFLEQIKTKGKRYMNFVSLSFFNAC